jgi:hypothetical protein
VKHDDAITGWSFDCPVDAAGRPPDGGLQIHDVRHDGHNFAKDIRVVALWLEVERVDARGTATISDKRIRILGSSNLFEVSKVRTLVPEEATEALPTIRGAAEPQPLFRVFTYLKEVDDTLYFNRYFRNGRNYVAYGVSARYDAPKLFSDLNFENCDVKGLSIDQTFLFSRYSNEPRHEPSGGLWAARFHPFLHYTATPNPDFDRRKPHTRLKGVRFDYRLHLVLDRHHDLAENKKLKQLGNEAGVFTDSDSAGITIDTVIGRTIGKEHKPDIPPSSYSGSQKSQRAVSWGAFDAVEKPLVTEIIAPGLVKGFPVYSYLAKSEPERSKKFRCWDNIHWWGARGRGAPLPSTPGAFHCAHVHWRWGAAISVTTTSPPFNPDTWPDEMGSGKFPVSQFPPLVDPDIFTQSIWIAVTRNAPSLDPAKQRLVDLSESDWKTLFDPGLRPEPWPIKDGADIVLWYMAEVHRQAALNPDLFVNAGDAYAKAGVDEVIFQSALSGTVFLHGIFFAHDAEPDKWFVGNLAAARGTEEEIYRPRTEAQILKSHAWLRWAE